MAVVPFTARATLESATTGDSVEWQVLLRVQDLEGLYSGLTVEIGDSLFIDTTASVPGSVSAYWVTVVAAQSVTHVQCTVVLAYPDSLPSLPDLSWAVGEHGFLCRLSPRLKLSSLPTPEVQGLPQRFNVFVRNFEMFQIIDNLGSGTAGGTVQDVLFSEVSPVVLLDVPEDQALDNLEITVVDAWDGAGAFLRIGTAGDPGRFFDDQELELQVQGLSFEKSLAVIGPLQILASFAAGTGGTSGRCRIQISTTQLVQP